MRPNRVLFASYSFPPSANVGVFRALRFVSCLPAFGWEAVILASEPEAKTRLDISLAAKVPSSTVIRRVPIVRTEEVIKNRFHFLLGLLTRKANSSTNSSKSLPNPLGSAIPLESEDGSANLKNKLKEFFFAIPDDRVAWKKPAVRAGMELVRAHRPEVVLATAPPFSTMLVAAEIARKAKLPLVLDFRDPWTRVPWGPRNKSKYGQRRAIQLERFCVSQAARVILNTEALKSDFLRHYQEMDAKKFCCIPNGYDNDLLDQVASMAPARANAPSCFTILHPGSLYRRRDPTPILHALAKLKSAGNEVCFQQLGHCDPVFGLETLAQQLGVTSNLQVCSAIPHQQMLQRMLDVDAFCLVQPDTDLQVPGKLFEMILFRKPILALTGKGALADIILKFQLGAVADPTNTDEIARAIVSLTSLDKKTPRWDDVLREFDGRKLTEKLSSVLAEAVRN